MLTLMVNLSQDKERELRGMSKFIESNGWKNYGDVNPIEYGGIFILQDEEFPTCYNVVEVISLGWECGEKGFLVRAGYVDLTDDWIEWDSVGSYADIAESDEDVYKVLGAWNYYGAIEFGGQDLKYGSEEEVVEELETYGIEVVL